MVPSFLAKTDRQTAVAQPISDEKISESSKDPGFTPQPEQIKKLWGRAQKPVATLRLPTYLHIYIFIDTFTYDLHYFAWIKLDHSTSEVSERSERT
jgi:hypothetical protein